jgi:hypothetical protein
MLQVNSYKTCRAVTAAASMYSSTAADLSHTCSSQSLLLISSC